MSRILICADAHDAIGTGHLRRMITLAVELLTRPAVSVAFQTSVLGARILKSANLPPCKVIVAATDLAGVTRTLQSRTYDAVVLDNYHWSASTEAPLRNCTNTICVFDDLANRAHVADILIDQNAHHAPADYAGLVPDNCIVLAGAAFTMLPEAFRTPAVRAANPAALPDDAPVFVSLGGGDPHRDLLRVITTLLNGTSLRLTIATGGHIADADALRSLANRNPNRVDLHIDSTSVAAQMMRSRFAVAAGGTMTWERAVIGLPSLCLVIADNQWDSSVWLADREIHDMFDMRSAWSETALLKAVERLMSDHDRQHQFSRKSKSLISGEGVVSVANALLNSFSPPTP